MPSTLFHLRTGYEFAKKYKNYNTPEFYLGVIAPDAVNLNGFEKKDIRWKSHNRDWNLEVWKKNVLKLYNDLKNTNDNVYLLGYVFHIFTDIAVDDLYFNKGIYENMLKKGIKPEDVFEYFNKQIQQYAKSQLGKQWWNEVVDKLNVAEADNINGINAEMINKWKEKEIKYYCKVEKENYDYIKPQFLALTTNAVIAILKENRIID